MEALTESTRKRTQLVVLNLNKGLILDILLSSFEVDVCIQYSMCVRIHVCNTFVCAPVYVWVHPSRAHVYACMCVHFCICVCVQNLGRSGARRSALAVYVSQAGQG